MINIKVNGKPIEYPTGWEEVNFKTFLKLIGKTKKESIIIILESLGVDTSNSKIQGLEVIMKASKFLDKTPLIEETPTRIGKYSIPKTIEEETWEQYDKMGELIRKVTQSDDIVEQTEVIAYYAAIYVQGFKEPFDAEKANYLAGEFMGLPCLEVMSVGSFFQARYLSMESGLSMTSLRKNIQMTKSRPVFKSLVKTLGRMLHLTASRDM